MPEFAPVTRAFCPLRTLLIGQTGITASGRFSSRRCCCMRSSWDGINMGRAGGSLTSSIWFMDSDLVIFGSECFVQWLVERCGESLQIFATSESFGKDMTNPSTCVRELSHDAMPMPTKVPRAHHQASEVQEHAAIAGLSKLHFHASWTSRAFNSSSFSLHVLLRLRSHQFGRKLSRGLTFRHSRRATFLCKVFLRRPTYQWPMACALNQATAPNDEERLIANPLSHKQQQE